MRYVFFFSFALALIAGCETPQPRYAFSFSGAATGWSRYHPTRADPEQLRVRLVNEAHAAVILVFVDGTFVRQPASLAAEIRVRFAGTKVIVSDIDDADPSFVRFQLKDTARGRAGRAIVIRRAGMPHRIVAIGWWPSMEDDARRADMERMLREVAVISLD